MVAYRLCIAFLLLGAAAALVRRDAPQLLYTRNPCRYMDSFNIDCNSCKCSTDGQPACTMMACNLNYDECIPGSYFVAGKMFCPCPSDGMKLTSYCFL